MKKGVFILVCACCLWTVTGQTKSWKRGACMSNLNEADVPALQQGMTWFYDWAAAPSTVGVTAVIM